MPLTKKQLDELKQLLLQERNEILRGVRKGATGEASMSGDLVDQSTDLSEREMELELAEHDRERLLQVEEALHRMAENVYGVCLESGEEIPYERLKAVPTAKYTVRCQEMLERRRYLQ
ncbi:MAG: TraR/DksA family transcriptional regulator [Candidatus Omnitrophica bacterium]|nr:General stress protein 16O [bacterium]NUN96082.1 TraR/DksA family transcriptional regulator [Candidatus Omnitrophota bacterium]